MKRAQLLSLLILFAVIPLAIYTGMQSQDNRSKASANFTPTSGRPFADNSPFNDPIGTNVQLDPNSASMVSKAAASPAIADMIEFGTPIFFADASTPKYSIKCSAGYGHCHLEDQQVPIPAGAQSAPGSDGQMVVVDLSTNKTYDFWIYKNDHANTAWGDVIDITGPGYDSPENSALGAGTSRLSGIVRTYEMTSSIEHALVFSTTSCDKQMRVPATKSDGQSGGIPEGARFQLDPSINVDTIAGITPGEKVVAKAMQKYGAYAIDCGGASMALQFENPIGKTDPYAGVGFSNDYFAMSHIPWDKMRVLNAWNSYTPGVQPTTGGGGAAPTVAPTLLVPTYSCISGVPCTSPGPTQDPNITSAPITPGGGGGETNPTTSPNNPEPTTTQPCGSTNSIVTAKHHKRHKKYRRGGGGFLQQFIQFIMKFIMYLLERLGIQVPNIPTPTDPGNGNPCPQPTTAVEPTTAIIAPTTAIQPTTIPVATIAPTLVVNPTSPTIPTTTTTNWAGYYINQPMAVNSSITTKWTITPITCSSVKGILSPWPGMGGWNDGSIAQLGNDMQCNNNGTASYPAWSEAFPAPSVYYNNPVGLGDKMSATVTFQGNGNFATSMTNTTKGWTINAPMALGASFVPQSAEIIFEALGTEVPRIVPPFGPTTFTDSIYSPDGQQQLPLASAPNLRSTNLGKSTVQITTGPITGGIFTVTKAN